MVVGSKTNKHKKGPERVDRTQANRNIKELIMKSINVLSYGGGTQSTALLLKLLSQGIQIDEIIFADTQNEEQYIYDQIEKVNQYIIDKYYKSINIISTTSLIDDQIKFYKGQLNRVDHIPFWLVDNNGNIGKLPFSQCSVAYKINPIRKYIRNKYGLVNINMFIGYSIDEITRVKDSKFKNTVHHFPLIDWNMTKIDCIEYVKNELGFIPKSSVCYMCFANDFERVYLTFLNDSIRWQKILELDEVLDKQKRLNNKVYAFRFQALLDKRFKDIDMNQLKSTKYNIKQLSIFDFECNNSCYL